MQKKLKKATKEFSETQINYSIITPCNKSKMKYINHLITLDWTIQIHFSTRVKGGYILDFVPLSLSFTFTLERGTKKSYYLFPWEQLKLLRL